MLTDERDISLAMERKLEEEWERWNAENSVEFEYDPYEEAEALWEAQDGR